MTSLYDRNMCQVSYKGQQYEGFGMTSGVRQGCPLSPLLYAIAADALLEKVSALIPDAVVRAYADDTAVVLTDFWSQAHLLAHAFDEFGNLSNLRLNHKKMRDHSVEPTRAYSTRGPRANHVQPSNGPIGKTSAGPTHTFTNMGPHVN